MYQVRTDSRKNRLYLTFAEPNRQDLRKALKEIEKLCLTLQANFTCLTDLRNCMPISEEMKELLELDPDGEVLFHKLTPGKIRSLLHIVNKVRM